MGECLSFYADYLTERTNDEIIETVHGFITYRFLDDNRCYIVDLYIAPEYRQTARATSLANLVIEKAKAKGVTELLGTVVPSTKGATISLKVLLGYGMELLSASENLIVFRKRI